MPPVPLLPKKTSLSFDKMLHDYGEFVQVLPVKIPGFQTSPGLTEWQGQSLHPDMCHALRVWPHQNDTGGFFVAVLEKSADPRSQADNAPIDTPQRLTVNEERTPWLTLLSDQFGIDPAHFDDYVVFREGRRGVYIANHDQQPPQKTEARRSGYAIHAHRR